MKVIEVCHDCQRQHTLDFDPRLGPGAGFSDWLTKHPGHNVQFLMPQRRQRDRRDLELVPSQTPLPGWMAYLHNGDVKTAYGASAAPTMTLASLAASSTLLAGRESSAIDNGTNRYLDYYLAGHYRTGASNLQAGRIVTAVVGARNDTPAWPDVFDGTDSTETVTVQAMYDQICRVVSDIVTDTTQRTWPFGPVTLAGLFGGVLPDQFVIFTSHSAHTSTNVWSATEGDHALSLTPIYATVS